MGQTLFGHTNGGRSCVICTKQIEVGDKVVQMGTVLESSVHNSVFVDDYGKYAHIWHFMATEAVKE